MESKNSFKLFIDYKQHFELLKDAEKGVLIMAIFEYEESGTIIKMSRHVKMAFSFIKRNLDSAKVQYEATCLKNKESIEKYWKKKRAKEKDTNEYDRIRANTNVNHKEKEKGKDKETDKDNKPIIKNIKHSCPARQDVRDIISYLNQECNKNFNDKTRKTNDLIKARFKEGFKVADFKRVIDNKKDDSYFISHNFLRPLTLFSNKFESYLNEQDSRPDFKKTEAGGYQL